MGDPRIPTRAAPHCRTCNQDPSRADHLCEKNRTQRPLAACGPHLRDYCAHLLIPLNECRHKNYYLPWKCEHERHDYETCEYKEYTRRMHNQKVKKLMAEARE